MSSPALSRLASSRGHPLGAGPDDVRHLAWMLLFNASGSRSIADDWYCSFAEEVLVRLPEEGTAPGLEEIGAWLDAMPG